MLRPLLTLALIAAIALPASARPDRDDDKHQQKQHEKQEKKYWKEQDKQEKEYWKAREKEAREHDRHRYHSNEADREHRDWDHANPSHRHPAPPWMNPYWHAGETRRYVALVPGDPSRIYVFVDGHWALRKVSDPRARLDLEGAYRLPAALPPIAPPQVGLSFHIVLFN
jgi:hypothetical protein